MSLTDYEMLQNEVAEQQQEIAEIKAARQQDAAEIKNSESVRASIAALADTRINGFINENNELKAQVETLRAAAIFTDKEFRHHAMVESFETTVLSEALAKTREQSLQSVKADAVDDVYDMIATDGANIEDAGELIGHTRVLLSVGERANKLREGKS